MFFPIILLPYFLLFSIFSQAHNSIPGQHLPENDNKNNECQDLQKAYNKASPY